MAQGNKGYGYEEIRRLIRIRHLRQDLGLDLMAVDCILRMRKQIATLQQQLNEMEQRMLQREQELLQEIQNLNKRLAIKSDWEAISEGFFNTVRGPAYGIGILLICFNHQKKSPDPGL